LKSLPLLLERINEYHSKGGKGAIDIKDATGIIGDVGKYLSKEEKLIQE